MNPALQVSKTHDPAIQPQDREASPLRSPDFRALFEIVPGAHLVLLPDAPHFTVVAVSNDHLRGSRMTREEVVGRGVFEVFPDNPNDPASQGTKILAASLHRAIATRAPDQIGVLRYDVRRPGRDGFEERYWTALNKPVLSENGDVEYMLHTTTEITQTILLDRSRPGAEPASERPPETHFGNAEILESITDGFMAMDPEWNFTYINAAAQRILHASRVELLGKNHWELYPETLGTVVEREYRRAVLERVPVECEFFYEPRKRWFAIRGYPIREGGLAVYFEDSTQRRNAQLLLRQSEERFSMAFAEAPIGMVLTNPDGRITEVNQAWLNMLGYTREEVTLRDSAHITHPEDIAATRQFFAALEQDSRSSATIEKRYIRKDGQVLWARASTSVLHDDQGRPRQLIAIIEDITQRKQAEEQLRESQQRLRAIYDGTWEYIGLLAPDGTLLDANRASLEFAGNTREEVVGRLFEEAPWFAHTPGAPELVRESVSRAAAGEFVRFEGTLNRPPGPFSKGERMTFDISLHPVWNERGEVVLIVPEAHDITERKAMEQRDAFLVELNARTRLLTEPREIARTVAALLCEHLHADHGVYIDIEDEAADFTRFSDECRRLVYEGKPFLVENAETDARLTSSLDFYRRERIRSVVCAPLLNDGHVIAVMVIRNREPHEWRQHEVELVQLVAGQCWESMERARVSLELKASEQWLRLAQKAGRIGTFEWLMNTGELIWTPEMEQLYGLHKGTFERDFEGWRNRVFPEDAARIMTGVQNCVARKQEGFTDEFRAVLPDGTLRWLLVQAQFIYNESGAAERLVGVNIDIDARKQAESHLQRQWRTFDTALSNTPDFTYIFDLEGRFAYANRALLSLLQIPFEAAVGKTFIELGYPPQLAERLQRQIQQVIETRQPVRDQTPFAGPQGESRHYEYIFVPVIAAEGRVGAVAGSTRDITERKQAEELVEADRRRWRDLLFQAPAAIAVLQGPEHHYEWVNSYYANLVGRPASALVGMPVREAFPEVVAQGYGALLDDVFRSGKPHIAHEALLRIGEDAVREYHIDFVYMATRDSQGSIDGIFVHATDVTDVVKARKQAEESEARYRFLAESIPQMVWTATPDGALDYVSSQVASYFGKSTDEILGIGWLAGVHPDDQGAVLERWQQSLSSGEPYEAEFRLRRGLDGAWRWFLVRARSMASPEGQSENRILRWVGTCTDIHDQKENEAALRKANRELEEFAYVASHDLQEPLRMVSIYTQLILKQIGGEEQAQDSAHLTQYAGFVRNGTQRMQTLIRDLLTFSRTVHTDELPTGAADLSVALLEATSLLGDRIEECGAAIKVNALPRVTGDTAQLAHVFQNIISNALKYRRKDVPPEIRVYAEPDGRNWVVSVQDNGIGFEEQYAERIFGLFKRLHNEEYPGTGLGLAICKRIVERYGGRMWAQGKVGEGATFRFSLPEAED